MRSLKLARIAAHAELLRLRRFGERQMARAALAAFALVFLLACLASLHVAGYFALRRGGIQPLWAALIVAGVDLLIALILGLTAARSRPGRLEREALEVRLAAQHHLMDAAAVSTLVGPLLRSLGARKVFALVLGALIAQLFRARR